MTGCSIEGCDRPHKGRGLCRLHLRRLNDFGDPLVTKKARPFKGCAIEGCEKKHFARGWCRTHYIRWWERGDTTVVRPPKGTTERFLRLYQNYEGDDCIEWPFAKIRGGYGWAKVNNVGGVASRWMCEMAHGEPPSPIHEAAHSCGNRPCINPNHLRWATPPENDADKLIHGTDTRGERNGVAKLTEDEVREIRRLSSTCSSSDLSERFGVSANRINAIINRIGWRHVA